MNNDRRFINAPIWISPLLAAVAACIFLLLAFGVHLTGTTLKDAQDLGLFFLAAAFVL